MSPLLASFVAGIGTALVAWLSFGVVHAFWIRPIWDRLLGGLPFALIAALTISWAYAEARRGARLPASSTKAGLLFGLGAWSLLLPATLLANLLRVAGLHAPEAAWPDILEIGLTASLGLIAGHRLAPGRRPPIAVGLGGAVLLATQAGPIPAVNSSRAAGLLLLMLPIYSLAGLIQGLLTGHLSRDPEAPSTGPVS